MSKITVICGSHRQASQSLKIGKMLADKCEKQTGFDEVDLIDLATLQLPQWSESYSQDEQMILDETKAQLSHSQAFIVITPEWHGMVTSALRNLFLLYTSDVFGHKPALIATVSAGQGGAYPVNELRSTVYKNSRLNFIPEHLIFRHVGSMFNNDENDDQRSQSYMSKRSDYALEYLYLYSEALSHVRENAPNNASYPNGM